MTTAAVTNAFVAGNTIIASQVNQNFADVLTFLNTTGVNVFQPASITAPALAFDAVTTNAILDQNITQGKLAAGVIAMPVGSVLDHAGRSAPPLFLLAAGQAVSRTTYAALFAAIVDTLGVVTVTLASPGVWTRVAHGLVIGDPVFVTTTGILPTGVSANTTYFVMTTPTVDTFTLGTTRTVTLSTGVAVVSVAVNTSVSQSGVHTLMAAPHGITNSTTFNVPDYRGRRSIAPDNMGGSVAGRTTGNANIGIGAGEQFHSLVTAELSNHVHSVGPHAHTMGNHVHDLSGHTHVYGGINTGTDSGNYSGGNLIQNGAGQQKTHFHFIPSTNTGGGSTNSGGPTNNNTDNSTAFNSASPSDPGAVVNGAGHNNMSPYLTALKIIFAGV